MLKQLVSSKAANNVELFDRTAQILTDLDAARPTQAVSSELQQLFDRFNAELFGRQLPDCMLTIDISRRTTLGYYRPNAFTTVDGRIIDQIALNPKYMITRPMREVASTVAHEMVHLFMVRCAGRKIGRGYHCKDWGRKMQEIGLMPSNTGKPDGKQTGYQMTHYPIAGGRFLGIVATLEKEEFAITWGKFQRDLEQDEDESNKDPSKGKVKLECPQCRQACWGSPNLDIICGKDRHRMLRALP